VYALAITFGLLDDDLAELAGKRLATLVADGGFHIQTGFAGTPFVTDALTRTGHLDHAYSLLLQTECPSWLYPVTMGATTIWERWDSMLPDGTINPGQMTSFNHYALGAVADWMHRAMLASSSLRGRVAGSPGPRPDWRRLAVVCRSSGSRSPGATCRWSCRFPRRSPQWFSCRTGPSTKSVPDSTASRHPRESTLNRFTETF
jgi:alpha-L-rhamnosidase